MKKVEAEVISTKSFERKCKREQFKRKVKEKVQETIYWINDNKEFLIIVIPAASAILTGGFKVIKSLSRNIALAQEKRIKDMRIYDRSMGKYIELRRPLKNNDMKTILERRENGEKLSNILMDLNLIK